MSEQKSHYTHAPTYRQFVLDVAQSKTLQSLNVIEQVIDDLEPDQRCAVIAYINKAYNFS